MGDDYIVVVISSAKEAEKILLRCLSANQCAVWDDVCYIAMGSCSNIIISKTSNNNMKSFDYLFFLINPSCLNKTGNHINCNTDIKSLFTNIRDKDKQIILWLHENDNVQESDIETLDKLTVYTKFHHSDNLRDISRNSPPEIFMFVVCKNGQNNFQDEFQKLIKASIKKKPNPHLIALSILCQGYLAAHGKEGFKISDGELQKKAEKNKEITELQNWWKPALGKKLDGKDLYNELETVDEDKKTGIGCLIKITENKKDEKEELYFDDKGKIVNDGMTEKFIGKVNDAYKTLSEILQGKS